MIRTIRYDRDLCWLGGISATALAVCMLYFVIFYLPALREEDTSKENLMSAKQQLALWKKEENRKLRIEEAIPFLKQMQEKRKKHFRSAEFSSMLSTSAAKGSVSIVGESYRAERNGNKNIVQIDIEGTYEGVRGLMDEIAGYPYFVLIDKFYMRAKKGNSLSARIIVVVHQQYLGEVDE